MTGKMDWDRVHKEDQIRRQGSATSSVIPLDRWGRRKKSKKKKSRPQRGFLSDPRMLGCTCGKPVGFLGLHKKQCPLSKAQGLPQTAQKAVVPQTKTLTEDEKWLLTHPPKNRPLPTLKELAAAIKALGRKAVVRDALSGHIVNPDGTPPRTEQHRKVAERIITAMLKELED